MDFCIEDTRKKPAPSLKELIKDKIVTLGQAKDWLQTIYEIRFFEEKVYDLLGENIIKGASHLYAGEEAVATGAIDSDRNTFVDALRRIRAAAVYPGVNK